MRSFLIVVAGVALAAAASAQQTPPTTIAVDRVVAVVGNEPILWSDVLEEINGLRQQGQRIPPDSAGQMVLAREIIGRLIDTQLILQRATEEKIEVTENEVTAEVDKRMQQVRSQFKSDTEFRDLLRQSGFGTPEEYRRWLIEERRRAQLQDKLIQKLRSEDKIPPAPVSERDIQEFYAKNRGEIPRLPATVTFRQIVVNVQAPPKAREAARAKAESLLVELRKGGDFEQIAKRESMDQASRETGGDIGWRRRGGGAEGVVPEFEFVIFRLGPGQLSPVFETTFGFHVARVDRIQPAEVKARHILIRPAMDSSDIAAARRRADSVAAAWRAGAAFDSLAARYHDPIEERSILNPFPRGQLPESYQKAIEGKGEGVVVDPFPIDDQARGVPKFVVLQLLEVKPEREPSLADFREQIKQRLAQEGGMRRLLDGWRKGTYVSVRI